jgi:ribosomal-protein-alanine N-acetyltransferase
MILFNPFQWLSFISPLDLFDPFGLLRPRPLALGPIDSRGAAACAAIHAPSFAHPWSEAEFESLLASSACLADGAFEGDEGPMQGFVLSRSAADEAEILTIAVQTRGRRRGTGKALLRRHMQRLSDKGVARLFLEVAEDNAAALALYRSLGFQQEGRRKGYYRRADGPAANALVMARTL